MIYYRKDKHQIVTLTLDMKGRSVNIINHEIAHALLPVIEQLETEYGQGGLAGVIIASGKRSFLAGGDLDYLHGLGKGDAEEAYKHIQVLQSIFRRIERLPVPVVALINGAALGSGYELALACHRRIAFDSPETVVGLPEVNLGMIPMGGSITRLNWLLGIETAFRIASQGKVYYVREAKRLGLIDEIVSDKKDLYLKARSWILSRPRLTKPWDEPNAQIPPRSNPIFRETLLLISRLNAELAAQTKGNYPAKQTVLNVLKEGALMDFDTAIRGTARSFIRLITGKECQNLTKAFWFDRNKICNGAQRPKGFGRFTARKVGVIGAGLMGSGIAHVCAMQGMEVVLKDVSVSIAQQGKEYSARLLESIVAKDKMTAEQKNEILHRITPTERFEDFGDCDLVIEAVFEGEQLKTRITREVEMYLHRDAFIASNTSSLSITQLSRACSHPDKYIGLHFFAPVPKQELVELIRGQYTSEETLARAFDFARQMHKLPIMVRDTPGFYVYRVSSRYIMEGLLLLAEGQPPAAVENLALQHGMNDGPLSMADRYSLKYLLSVEEQQIAPEYAPALELLGRLVRQFERQGKGRGAGIYDYAPGKERRLWSGLGALCTNNAPCLPATDIAERLLFVQCLEAIRCLQEEAIGSAAEANLGSIHGWGFVPFRGGTLQFVNDYGIERFAERCAQLQKYYGQRFAPPELLLDMCSKGLNFW